MARKHTPSFIIELPLVVTPEVDRILQSRMVAGQRLYNGVLHSALKWLRRMQESKDWQTARAMQRGNKRNRMFREVRDRFGLSEYHLHALATEMKNQAGWQNRLGAHETQKIATRVWNSLFEHMKGVRGRPRFKGRRRPLHSLEGKTNAAGPRWNAGVGAIEWKGLTLPAIIDDRSSYLQEALQANTKYSRVLWRTVKGQRRWFAQLIQQGHAPQKWAFLATGQVVGLDVGPSTIAVSGEYVTALETFAPSVEQPWKEIRRMQRAMDRSRRAMNPHNYNANGTVKKGAKQWKSSRRYLKLQTQYAECERRLSAGRKRDHGELANKILGVGNVIQTEKLSYKAFQRRYGKSVKQRAPGMFIDQLNRKAESAGGKLVELNTWSLKMSQYDHVTDSFSKKPLSQRWHSLGFGSADRLVQRDLYSAFLAQHASGNGHNPSQLSARWADAESLLRRAGLCRVESESGTAPAVPTVAIPSDRIARRRRLGQSHAPVVVAST